MKFYLKFILTLSLFNASAQLPIGRDTLTVFEVGKILRSPWAGGLNFCQFSKVDLNGDGKKDVVVFDKVNSFAYGVVRCFINESNAGETKYRVNGNLKSSFPAVDNWMFFYDYNNDGKEDLFTYVLGGNNYKVTLRVYRDCFNGLAPFDNPAFCEPKEKETINATV